MTKKSFPHVDLARMKGDTAALKAFGQRGGLNNARKRRAQAASDTRIANLEAGTSLQPKRRRPTLTVKRWLAMCDWVKNPKNYEDECAERDRQVHLDTHPID